MFFCLDSLVEQPIQNPLEDSAVGQEMKKDADVELIYECTICSKTFKTPSVRQGNFSKVAIFLSEYF